MFNHSFTAAIRDKVSFNLDTLPGAKTFRSAARSRLSLFLTRTIAVIYFLYFRHHRTLQ